MAIQGSFCVSHSSSFMFRSLDVRHVAGFLTVVNKRKAQRRQNCLRQVAKTTSLRNHEKRKDYKSFHSRKLYETFKHEGSVQPTFKQVFQQAQLIDKRKR